MEARTIILVVCMWLGWAMVLDCADIRRGQTDKQKPRKWSLFEGVISGRTGLQRPQPNKASEAMEDVTFTNPCAAHHQITYIKDISTLPGAQGKTFRPEKVLEEWCDPSSLPSTEKQTLSDNMVYQKCNSADRIFCYTKKTVLQVEYHLFGDIYLKTNVEVKEKCLCGKEEF